MAWDGALASNTYLKFTVGEVTASVSFPEAFKALGVEGGRKRNRGVPNIGTTGSMKWVLGSAGLPCSSQLL